MKKLIFIFIMVLLCTQARALDQNTVTITITINKPPDVTGFDAFDGSVVSTGDTLRITVDADDPNQDTLQYRFHIKNASRDEWTNWSTVESIDYEPGETDTGLNEIKAEVTDGRITVQTGVVEVYVFRNTVNLP